MTLPDERYRSLRGAAEFLQQLTDPRQTPRIPRKIRDQAHAVLRHYPGSWYIDELARRAPDLLAQEIEPVHRMILQHEQLKNK